MKDQPLRIIGLEIENILRVVAVNIRPDGRVVEFTGKNRQGKSSILNSVWIALGGEKAIPPTPIHDGAEAGHVIVELGDDTGMKFKVTRRLRGKEDGDYLTTLLVESADGRRFQKPQEILNTLVGALSMDPLRFIEMEEKARISLLRKFAPGFDFDANEAAIKAAFDKRTDVNRLAKQFRAQADGIQVQANAPAERVDETALVDALQKAGEHNAFIERERAERGQLSASAIAALADAGRKRERALELRQQADKLEAEAAEHESYGTGLRDGLESRPALPAPIDITQVRQRIDAARLANALVDKVERRQDMLAEAETAETESAELTAEIARLKDAAVKAVAASKMPVPGITFGDDAVLFDGFPLSQASGAQQLRISVAVAAALNPKLRFVRAEASRLDDESWAELEKLAAEMDLQIFCETVQSSRPTALVIEDGMVKQPALQAAE